MRKMVLGFVVWIGMTGYGLACPNVSTTITISLSAPAMLMIYDQNCNALPGPFVVGVPGSTLNSTTKPAVSPAVPSSDGLVFTANGAPSGQAGIMTIIHSPSGKSMPFSYVVGAPVTSISGGTITP